MTWPRFSRSLLRRRADFPAVLLRFGWDAGPGSRLCHPWARRATSACAGSCVVPAQEVTQVGERRSPQRARQSLLLFPALASPWARATRGKARPWGLAGAPRQAQLFEEGVVVLETAERNFQLMWPRMVPLEGAVPLIVPADRSSSQSSVPDCLRKPSFSEEASATFLLSEAVKAQVATAAFSPFPAAFTGLMKGTA